MSALVCIETSDDAKASALSLATRMFISGLTIPGLAEPKGMNRENDQERERRERAHQLLQQDIVHEYQHFCATLDAIEALAS